MISNQSFRISREAYGVSTYEIRFAEIYSDEKLALALPVTVEMRDRNACVAASPMMVVEREALQSLMDELWNVGIRPADIGTAGHLAATQAHLADFRSIVSKTLEVALP